MSSRITTQVDPGIHYMLAKGMIRGASHEVKYGFNLDIDIGTEDIISQGGTQNIIASPGLQLAVKSSSGNDDIDSGSGAQTVTLYYLDNDFVMQSEVINMEGVTLENTVATDIRRPYRLVVATTGASLINEGIISLVNTGDTLTFLQIPALYGQTQSTFFTIPAGYHATIFDWFSSCSLVTGACVFNLAITMDADGAWLEDIFINKRTVVVSGGSMLLPVGPIIVPAKTDIKVVATSDIANMQCASFYRMALELGI